MPLVVLKSAFICHYAGTVLPLAEPTGVAGWEPDERLREKQSYFSKQCFFLPDAGNGRSAELLVSDTLPCPAGVFDLIDICSGPCRVTSVEGMGAVSLRLHRTDIPVKGKNKQTLEMHWPEALPLPDAVVANNRMTGAVGPAVDLYGTLVQVPMTDWAPGFYELTFSKSKLPVVRMTVFKNYPLVVQFDDSGQHFTTTPTIW
jgi:hypothetical protein